MYYSDVLEGTYYLKGDLVLLEQAILQYFSERLEAMDLCQLSCPDMVRTVMMVSQEGSAAKGGSIKKGGGGIKQNLCGGGPLNYRDKS